METHLHDTFLLPPPLPGPADQVSQWRPTPTWTKARSGEGALKGIGDRSGKREKQHLSGVGATESRWHLGLDARLVFLLVAGDECFGEGVATDGIKGYGTLLSREIPCC